MVGTIVSLALSAAGAVASAVGSKKANDKQQAALDNQRAQSNAFYDSEIYQDPTQRSDNQAYLKLLDKKLKKANEIAEAKNTIMGGTHEQVLAQHQQSADAYSDAITQMVANTSQRRDSLMKEKRAAQIGYDQQQADIDAARAQNWANLASDAANLGVSAVEGFSGAGSETKKDKLGGDNSSGQLQKDTPDAVTTPAAQPAPGFNKNGKIDFIPPRY